MVSSPASQSSVPYLRHHGQTSIFTVLGCLFQCQVRGRRTRGFSGGSDQRNKSVISSDKVRGLMDPGPRSNNVAVNGISNIGAGSSANWLCDWSTGLNLSVPLVRTHQRGSCWNLPTTRSRRSCQTGHPTSSAHSKPQTSANGIISLFSQL